MRDAGYHAFENSSIARVLERAEAQGVITAMGRAPMVKISRIIPPTPVAAP